MQQCLLTEQRLLQAGEGLSKHVTWITDRWDGAFADGGVDSAQVPRLHDQDKLTGNKQGESLRGGNE